MTSAREPLPAAASQAAPLEAVGLDALAGSSRTSGFRDLQLSGPKGTPAGTKNSGFFGATASSFGGTRTNGFFGASSLPSLGPAPTFKRLVTVSGRIAEVKNLPKKDRFHKPDVYCMVKGIRANGNLVILYKTRIMEKTTGPKFDEAFSFKCPESWGTTQLVGLKFLVYHTDTPHRSDVGTDDFLGGADLDLFDAPLTKSRSHILALGARESHIPAPKNDMKSLIYVEVRVARETVPKPPPQEALLRRSLRTYTRVVGVRVNMCQVRNVRPSLKADPMCVVRIVTMSGRVDELCRRRMPSGLLRDGVLNDAFAHSFPDSGLAADEPMLLAFDVFDVDGDPDQRCPVTAIGPHIGSGWVPLRQIPSDVVTRKRVELLGQSQLLERFFGPDGEPRRREEEDFADSLVTPSQSVATDSESDAGSGFAALFKGRKQRKTSKATLLLIEIEVARAMEAMPLYPLLKRKIEVREEEDVETVMAWPDWSRAAFPVPPKLQRDADRGGRPRLASLVGQEVIRFISGTVRGASGLIRADVLSKSDPYCTVEAVTDTGATFFVHRTRHLDNTLAPEWQETFYCVVPEKVVVKRLKFSLQDYDGWLDQITEAIMGGGSTMGDGDDFLGHASMDLSGLCTGERFCEELVLTGLPSSETKQVAAADGNIAFRKRSTLAVEVYVERRVRPKYLILKDQLEWAPLPKHTVTQRKGVTGDDFGDPSQIENFADAVEVTAGQVLRAHELGELGKLDRLEEEEDEVPLTSNWRPSPPGPEGWLTRADEPRRRRRGGDLAAHRSGDLAGGFETDGMRMEREAAEEAALAARRRAARETTRGMYSGLSAVRRSGMPAAERCASLPAIGTKLGRGQDGGGASAGAPALPDLAAASAPRRAARFKSASVPPGLLRTMRGKLLPGWGRTAAPG